MKKRIHLYNVANDNLPDIGIVFCYNRAVVTLRKKEKPIGHREVGFGPLFFLRLIMTIAYVFYKNVR